MSQDSEAYYSAKELAGLPGMPKSKREVNRFIAREQIEGRTRTGKGGGKEYPMSCLPKQTQDALIMQKLNATVRFDDAMRALIDTKNQRADASALLSTPPATLEKTHEIAKPDKPAILDDKQKERDGSRRLILQTICTAKAQGKGLERAVALLNEGYAAGSLDPDLMHAIEHCNDKLNDARTGKLSARTVSRWQTDVKSNGHCVPKKTRVQTRWQDVPWASMLLACYRKPQKPHLTEAHAEFEKDWVAQGLKTEDCPKYDAAYRLLDKVPKVIREMGRSTGSELAALRPFIRRDWSGSSNEVWVGDGHSFKAKVRHPEHGQAFAPEVTVIIDAASRFIVGWAFSLSENQIAVSEALGKGMLKHGKPLIYYSDNGSGQTAKTIDCPAGGMLARLGVHHETGIPGNPQGRGIIEGLWDITTIAVAKTLPTFQGTGMDGGVLRQNTNAINSAKRRGEVPEFVTPWAKFIEVCESRFNWYNTEHQHSSLGGKTPAEVYHANFDERWACPLTEDETVNLYRPFVERVPSRGEVRFNTNIYFNQVLAELPEKAKVRVAFDLSDPSQVWVSDLQGRFICIAEFEANKRKGFAVSVVATLKDQRIDGMIKRKQEGIDLAEMERGNIIEGEVLQRVELIPAETMEPLKRVVVDGGDFGGQQSVDRQMTREETVKYLYGTNDNSASQ